MPRKCCALWDGISCDSGQPGSDFIGTMFTFPSGKSEKRQRQREQWISALPNYVNPATVTQDIGLCDKHWPSDRETEIVQGGVEKPIHPPTLFGNTPSTFSQQSSSTIARDTVKRGVTAKERRKSSEQAVKDADRIKSWESLVTYCSALNLIFTSDDTSIRLCKLSNSFPPDVVFSIQIDNSYHVTAFRGSTLISLYSILSSSFQHKLTSFTQVKEIVSFLENSEVDFRSELKAASDNILSLCETIETSDELNKKIIFICHQLLVSSYPGEHQGKQYDVYLISEACNLYLRSRNAYRALRTILILPNERTLRDFFGKFGSAGDASECIQAVNDVFSALDDIHKKIVFISADEIYVKPAIRYRGGHVIGFAQNQETPMPAKTVLAFMINFLKGSPAFVARLSPVTNLKHEFMMELLIVVVTIIHDAGGFVFGTVTDNLSVNEKCFKAIHERYTPETIHSCKHPVPNDYFPTFTTIYDTPHLIKNLRNNWYTEKTRELEFVDPETGQKLRAKWSDLVYIYKQEEKNIVKKTPLDYQTLYPNNFEKQKVQLVMNVFNEKVVAQLEHYGKHDTARFVFLFTRMWKILNIKSPEAGKHLNDPDREKIESKTDSRLDFLLKMATSIKVMDSGKRGARVRGMTSNTANAFHQTLHGMVDIIKKLLDLGFDYVLPGKIMSDRLEGEFGIYRCSAGGDYFITCDQVVNSLSMQRLKLYNKLDIQQSNEVERSCCVEDLESNDDDIELVDSCFLESSSLNEEERSTLYYISGYVAYKQGLGVAAPDNAYSTDSEFLTNVSRGKLSHPPGDLFDFSLYCYTFFKARSEKKKCCDKIYLQAYKIIYESTDYEFENIDRIIKRFSNSFFKAFVKKECDILKKEKDKKQLKKRKLNN